MQHLSRDTGMLTYKERHGLVHSWKRGLDRETKGACKDPRALLGTPENAIVDRAQRNAQTW